MIPFTKHRIALLVRVSRDEQEWQAQIERAKRSYENDNLEFPPEQHIYAEKASGFRNDALTRRTRLRELVASLSDGTLRGFRAVRVSRYFRNTRLGLELYDTLHRLGVTVTFIEGAAVDIFTREGRQWFLGKLAGAEAESLETSARVQDGKAAVHRQGRTNASLAGYGARKRRGVLRWVPAEARIVREALTWFHDTPDATAAGASDMLFEQHGQRFTPQTVRRWIKAPRYYGLVRHTPAPYGQQHASAEAVAVSKLRKAQWKPIVPRRWYRDNLAKLRANGHGGKGAHIRKRNAYVFAGVLRCAHCGGALFGEQRLVRSKPRAKYAPGYMCTNAKRFHTCAAKGRAVYEAELLKQAGQLIGQIAVPPAWVAQIAESARAMAVARDETRDARRALTRRRDQAAMDWARGKISKAQFDAFAAELEAEEVALSTSTAPTTSAVSEAQIEQMVRSLGTLNASWRKADAAKRRELISQIFESLTVNVFSKRIVRVEARAGWGALLVAAPAFRPAGETNMFDVAVDEPESWRLIRAALSELGQAPAYVLAARPGLSADAVRLAMRGMRAAAVIDVCDRVRLPNSYKMTNVWRLV